MKLPHAHLREDDMAGWLPEEAPPFTARELLGAFGRGIPAVFGLGLFLIAMLILLGASPGAHPGWW